MRRGQWKTRQVSCHCVFLCWSPHHPPRVPRPDTQTIPDLFLFPWPTSPLYSTPEAFKSYWFYLPKICLACLLPSSPLPPPGFKARTLCTGITHRVGEYLVSSQKSTRALLPFCGLRGPVKCSRSSSFFLLVASTTTCAFLFTSDAGLVFSTRLDRHSAPHRVGTK